VLAAGTVDAVRAGATLEDRFVELVGGRRETGEGLPWLRPE
jgi:ABC-2 type transport system ATP-binding protein